MSLLWLQILWTGWRDPRFRSEPARPAGICPTPDWRCGEPSEPEGGDASATTSRCDARRHAYQSEDTGMRRITAVLQLGIRIGGLVALVLVSGAHADVVCIKSAGT